MPDDHDTQADETQADTPTPAAESVPAAAGGTATEGQQADEAAAAKPARKTAAKKATASKTTAKKAAAKKTTAKKAAAAPPDEALPLEGEAPEQTAATEQAPAKKSAKKAPAKKTAAKRTTAKKTAAAPADEPSAGDEPAADDAVAAEKPAKKTAAKKTTATKTAARKKAAPEPETGDDATDEAGDAATAQTPLFQAPSAATTSTGKKTAARKTAAAAAAAADEPAEDDEDLEDEDSEDTEDGAEGEEGGSPARRRRRRGGRRRRRGGSGGQGGGDAADGSEDDDTPEDQAGGSTAESDSSDSDDAGDSGEGDSDGDGQGEGSGTSRRRRRRRRSGDGGGDDSGDDPANTVTRVRSSRTGEDQITALSGSTRLEAKKQRRREGREAGRRRAPIVSEAEFLARRESVERVMVIRERDDLTQIGVLEDKVLVEHYVARESQTSLIGNVYLGRVQNVLPSMEAAFIDIGKGRNAVLYAGEVNWSALGHRDGQPRKIESVLSSGQPVLVQVTKDPVGAKGARLTSQVSLAGRFLVYVPDGTTSGISRKLPDTERSRLKTLLKEIVPDTAGVIVRTAAEGASEEELTQDVERLKARWEDIEKKSKGSAPQLLYGEPDLTLKVVRDLFTEDFAKLVIQGDDAWETVQSYVTHVAPDLADRLERFEPATEGRDKGKDLFAAYRVDEQIAKGLDRKVWLPSGGSLVIDRTEAMTVVDVNTGKFTGSGGNLEETVTKNNLEAAEEIVRQLRLRDIGGIIVVDFIDMVLESNRDLVLRRLVECLGRDRTRHQVAEVTSLGLVQMTRKRIGTGLVESFSENCTHCQGRGLVIHDHPVEARGGGSDDDRGGRGGGGNSSGGSGASKRSRGGRGKGSDSGQGGGQGQSGQGQSGQGSGAPSPKDIAAMPRHEKPADEAPGTDVSTAEERVEETPAAAETTVAPAARRTGRTAEPEAAPDDHEPAERTSADREPTERTSAEREPAVVEQAPAAPAAPATTSGVVTRTRRAARTGPVTTGEGAAVVVETAAPAAASEAPVESSTPAPKVVTRTRSSRPARPAASGASAEGAASGTGGDTGGGTAEESGGPTVEHVPIKRKGARKR